MISASNQLEEASFWHLPPSAGGCQLPTAMPRKSQGVGRLSVMSAPVLASLRPELESGAGSLRDWPGHRRSGGPDGAGRGHPEHRPAHQRIRPGRAGFPPAPPLFQEELLVVVGARARSSTVRIAHRPLGDFVAYPAGRSPHARERPAVLESGLSDRVPQICLPTKVAYVEALGGDVARRRGGVGHAGRPRRGRSGRQPGRAARTRTFTPTQRPERRGRGLLLSAARTP